jgi:2-dehydropantoate 2-reductase
LVTTKTTAQHEVAEWLRPLLQRHDVGAVVAMQNGLGVEADLAEVCPTDMPVLGAMCFLCSNRVAPGHVVHVDYGRVTVGAFTVDGGPGGQTAEVMALVDDLQRAGVPAAPLDDLAEGRWRKLVWNIPYNGLSVVLDAGTDQLMANPDTRSLVQALMEDVVFVDTMLTTTDDMAPYATSMKLDHDAGRPMELDTIYATPLAAARAAGAPMLRAEMLLAQLRFIEAHRRP